MVVSVVVPHAAVRCLSVLHAGNVRSPAAVFDRIFTVFLVLGTLVGVVVVAYTLYNAYKYRAEAGRGAKAGSASPELGELPQGGGGGKKLFVSFFLSATIVLGLILWTYTTLLYIENGPVDSQQAQQRAIDDASPGVQAAAVPDGGSVAAPGTGGQVAQAGTNNTLDPIVITVVGHTFSWEFVYPNGHSQYGTLQVPRDRVIQLRVTSADVFHNFGIPGLRVKADAIPGQHTRTWFVAHRTGEYGAHCYELCGPGHANMDATVDVVPRTEYEEWYANTNGTSESAGDATSGGETHE